jgi:glycosyltransferase involved in cell wall biosynthesis
MLGKVELSVVIPVFNEMENVSILCNRLTMACDSLNRSYEILFVDDASTDGTYEILKGLRSQDERIRAIRFRRNYGQTAAMAAGFEYARGNIIISMDGDMQNDPADVPRLLEKLGDGYDVVTGWRKDRKDKFWSRRLPSLVANWIIGLITGVPIHDNGCSLKAYRASVIRSVMLYGELHRFIPAMSTLVGARVAEIMVSHHPRTFGKSKYGMSRVWRVLLDIITVKMITGFASRPSAWFGILSVPFIVLGFGGLLAGSRMFFGNLIEEWVVISTASLLFFFLGAHLVSIGFIGELFVKTGDYSPKKSIKETIEIL